MTEPASSPVPDWETFVRQHVQNNVPEVEIPSLRPGDRLLVLTQHTIYQFVMRTGAEALLSTNRPERPSGPVQLHGCTFGASSSIKPDHLFCGGNLEFRHHEGREIYTTTEIRALQVLRSEPATPTDPA